MAENWQSPKAWVHPPDGALPRGASSVQRRPRPTPARRPLGTVALGVGAASVFTTLFSAGLAFVWGGLLALPALWLGRVAGRRSAELLAWAGLGLACVGCAAWTLLF